MRGTVHSKTENTLVVDVNGVGYEVQMSRSSILELGETGTTVQLEVYTHYTESSLQLYGFTSADEKTIFKKVISVSGIGPKIGLSIVSAYPHEHLINSIVQGDLVALTNISGIGKKTAERIIIELKDKFKAMNITRTHAGPAPLTPLDSRREDALQALISLGYSENLARRALQRVEGAETDSVQNLIKKSLGVMSQ